MLTSSWMRSVAMQLLQAADAQDAAASLPVAQAPLPQPTNQGTPLTGGSTTISDSGNPGVPWGQGMLPEASGNREPLPRDYGSHMDLWRTAQVEKWPGPDGKEFNMMDYTPKGAAAIHEVIVWLFNSPRGQAWRALPGHQILSALQPPVA